MKRQTTFFLLLLALLPAEGARIAHADDVMVHTSPSSDDTLDDVRVLLPSGRGMSETQTAPAAPARMWPDSQKPALEVAISSWNPSSLTLNSDVENASTFRENGVPALSAAYVSSPVLTGRAGTVALRGGIGINLLERTGMLQIPGSSQPYSQQAYLIPVELGFEIRPAVLQWRSLSVLMDASLLPTMMLTERSPFDSGRTLFGFPARFLVGGSYDVRGLLPVNTPTFFELGVSQTVGSVSEGSMNGTGILAGVRVAI